MVYRNIQGSSATQMGMTLKCSSSIPCEGIKLENVELSYNGGNILASCSNANVLRKGTVSPSCPWYNVPMKILGEKKHIQ